LPAGKTILKIKLVGGEEKMLGSKVLQRDDLVYLKSVGATLPNK